MLTDPLDRAVKLIEEHFRSFPAALPVPLCRSLSLFQSRRGEFERTCHSPLESGAETTARGLPGDELNSSTVNLLKTAVNLFPPGFFRALVDCVIKALNQGIDQRSTGLSGKP